MRRLSAFLAIGSLLAMLAVISPVATVTAGACGWYTEHTTYSSASVYESGYGYVTWNWMLRTYNDGCGDKQYLSGVYTTDLNSPTPENITAGERVWICGSYYGSYAGQVTYAAHSLYHASPVYYYGPCARQADNYVGDNGPASFVYSGGYSPASTSRYINQG